LGGGGGGGSPYTGLDVDPVWYTQGFTGMVGDPQKYNVILGQPHIDIYNQDTRP